MYLGHFNKQPLLFFGGPYSNYDALVALRQQANQLKIAPDRIICSGDIVAYCSQPSETVEAIRDWGIHAIMGNCEESFANNSEDCGCGFSEGTQCNLLAVEWYQYASRQLSTEQRQWFSELPRTITLNFGNRLIQVVHGSVTSINQFLFASDNTDLYQQQLQQTQADIVIAGHCGLPFSKRIDQQLWHNTGSIGMPANDGSTHTWFSLVSYEKDRIKIQTLPLAYNHLQAASTMSKAGLDNGYSKALLSGLWPSMDVLPEKERSQRGKPIETATVYF